jgi:uncharacterized protein (TIGR01777 family)
MRPDPFLSRPPVTVVISGASGLIGTALVARLQARGHRVRRLVRGGLRREPDDIPWDPARGTLEPHALEGADAIVSLAGEPVAHRWTPDRKLAIRESRVRGTETLARAVLAMARPPQVFVSGSAVGYYGDGGDTLLDESSPPGSDFLASVTMEWEQATAPIASTSTRVVLLRTGVVMSTTGGALAKLLPPFRLGMGGPIGTGRQWLSWIALDDEVRAIEHALFTDSLRGPVNLTAPNPVTNAEFATTLGRVLARPALIPLPAVALRLLYGEMAEATILAGQRVLPKALLASGFEFEWPTLEGALRHELQ